ncbi:MAG: hypothetical protein P4N59_17875 [Negativicutes bacterium]|nr:hypothetical protein [Negativicutes bacterium]
MRKNARLIVFIILILVLPLFMLYSASIVGNVVVFVLDTFHFVTIAADDRRSLSYDPDSIEVFDDYIAVNTRLVSLGSTNFETGVRKTIIFLRPATRIYKIDASEASAWLPIPPGSAFDALLSAVLDQCRSKKLAAKPTPFWAPADRIYAARTNENGMFYFLPSTIEIESDTIHFQSIYMGPPSNSAEKYILFSNQYKISDNKGRNISAKIYDWQGKFLRDKKTDDWATPSLEQAGWALHRGVFFYCRANGLLPDYPAIPPETERHYLPLPAADNVQYFVPLTVEGDERELTAQFGVVFANPSGAVKQTVGQVYLLPGKNRIRFALVRHYDESGQLVGTAPNEDYNTFSDNSASALLFNSLVTHYRQAHPLSK